MIVSMHVATGALVGVATGSRRRALAVGLASHVIGDWIPHDNVPLVSFELCTGVAGVLALAFVRGPGDPMTVGAAAAVAPDLEHVLRLPRPGGRKLFPSHRFAAWHNQGGLPVCLQLLAAGTILAGLLASGRPGGIKTPAIAYR